MPTRSKQLSSAIGSKVPQDTSVDEEHLHNRTRAGRECAQPERDTSLLDRGPSNCRRAGPRHKGMSTAQSEGCQETRIGSCDCRRRRPLLLEDASPDNRQHHRILANVARLSRSGRPSSQSWSNMMP